MDGYLTDQDVALRLGVKVETVRNWVRQGKLPGLSLGRAGYRISEAAYEAFVQKKTCSQQLSDNMIPSFSEITERKKRDDALASLVAIVDSSHDAIIGKTLDGIITSWNAGAARLYGYKASEVLGQPIAIIIPEERRAEYAQFMDRLRRGERIDSLDTVRMRKEGTLIPVSLTLSPVRNAEGELIGASSIARDITERVRMEEALLASEKRFRAIFEQAAVGITRVSPDGRFLEVNQRLCDLVGYSHEELLELSFQDITFPEDLEPDLAYMQQLLSGKLKTYSIEKRYMCRDGSILWVNLAVSLVRDKDGMPSYCISVIEDISERKRLERLRDEFLAMASHELRTPLTSLKGFSALLSQRLTRTNDEQSIAYLTRMESQLTRLGRLVEDLLDLSRIQLDQLSLEAELVDLAAIVRETMEMAQATTTKHLQLIESEQAADMLIEGDLTRLTQVIYILLDNAIKYSQRADHVDIYIFTKDQQAIVQIQDFGIGIAPEHQKQIFERFFQVPDPVAKTFPGMGIGLYLAHDIITRHQGSISVESCPGKGSTFTVQLPLASPRSGSVAE